MARFHCDRERYHPDGPCVQDPDVCGHWCCKVVYWNHQGGLRVSSDATPHVRERDARHAPRGSDPAWEKGLVGEHRPDGSFMPLLDNDCTAMTIGQAKHLGGSRYVEERLRATKDPHAQQLAATAAITGA